jgi:dipeptidyl aminopeptidase/acylaminoacyl peptidase
VTDDFTETVRWLDPILASLSSKLARAFVGKKVTLSSWSRDRRKIVVLVEDGNAPVARYLFDSQSLQAMPIGGEVDGFEASTFGQKKKFTYQARDGQNITTWLTLPAQGSSARKPMVVMPHGGPASHDDAGFDYFAQFLASRGYAVLQPQFRGSTGFGRAFEEAGVGEWGTKMQDDVSDGVAWAIGMGYAMAGNIAIVGASYGGYAALAGATMAPDLYACAASINGVSNLGLFQGYRERDATKRTNSLAYWEYHMGLTRYEESKVRARSPAFLADKVRAPILLMHGTQDIVVPIIQSRVMADALRAAGKTYEFIELDKDDHYLSLMSSRIKVLEELERFLASHLKA